MLFDRFSGVQPLVSPHVPFCHGLRSVADYVQASGEGTHFLVPWLQRAILYDVRIKPRVSGLESHQISRLSDWDADVSP